MVAESDTEAWAVREKLAGLVAQLEALVEDVVSAARLAALDVDTVCQMMKDEVFRWKFVSGSSATRSMSSYAYKHIRGHPSQMYDMGAEVGSGAFGSVRQAKHRQTHEMHAVKGIPKDKVSVHHLFAEMDLIKQLDHPHIMRMYNTFEDETQLYICSELCSGGALFETLSKVGILEEKVASILFKQIIGVISYLHARSICHRDIKPENFLVLRQAEIKNMHLKLIDFGTA
jgi:calcium-dependent protein kinase